MYLTKKKRVLEIAIVEAENFIKSAEDAIIAIEYEEGKKYQKCTLKEVATAKRKSMDLTNALVSVRKPS